MGAAGLAVENSKGECNDGQHEINFHYGPALRTADEHSIYKTGAKEIAAPGGHGDHVHGQVRRARGLVVPHPHVACGGSDDAGFERFVAGQLACLRELTLFYAPNINSYKRFAPGSFAPTAVAWGNDNRTCAVRVVGHGDSRRFELRLPGRRRQPVPRAGGDDRRRRCTGSIAELELEPPLEGNAYAADKPHVPTHAARGARAVRRQRRSRATAFGEEVVEHYLNNARVELEAFESFVTDWERVRGFERL